MKTGCEMQFLCWGYKDCDFKDEENGCTSVGVHNKCLNKACQSYMMFDRIHKLKEDGLDWVLDKAEYQVKKNMRLV